MVNISAYNNTIINLNLTKKGKKIFKKIANWLVITFPFFVEIKEVKQNYMILEDRMKNSKKSLYNTYKYLIVNNISASIIEYREKSKEIVLIFDDILIEEK